MSGIELNHSPPHKNLFHRRQSFRDIQGSISKMNPELVKTVIESGKKPTSVAFSMQETIPLTIFYNGIVSVYQVSPGQAETLIKFAYGKETPTSPSHHKLQTLNRGKLDCDESCSDLPIARKRSLQRFLKKRKGRSISSLLNIYIKQDSVL